MCQTLTVIRACQSHSILLGMSSHDGGSEELVCLVFCMSTLKITFCLVLLASGKLVGVSEEVWNIYAYQKRTGL